MPVVSDKYRGTTDYALVLGELVRAAQYRGLTTYQDIALLVGLRQSGQHMGKEIGLILGAISEDEAPCRAADAECRRGQCQRGPWPRVFRTRSRVGAS